ncbi:tyrosine aminotransferase [Chrysoperla carnea]|uniref:tyrosine aminotransferase n=1 Tax=Chrysoperla carnea TaxID=189513 RepID=UPI001D073DF8|nr:tyrosine aminotransferase [Chrysoperla carnea]
MLQNQYIENKTCRKTEWKISSSQFSKLTKNSIRAIIENLQIEPNPDKQLIPLSIGDPTTFGNLKCPPEVVTAIKKSLDSFQYNGYAPSTGHGAARESVAAYSNKINGTSITSNDVILCSGCSGALELCINVLGERDKNILVPRPGFDVYSTLAGGLGIEIRYYNLIPSKGWEIDLIDLELQIDNNTTAIVVINPSNPCGSVYSEEHLRDIITIAERNYVPIIADEIYEHIVFPNEKFVSMATLSENVPILSCSGLSKRYLVPGWRLGWIVIHDRNNLFNCEVRKSLQSVAQRINGANTIIQGALPDILTNTLETFYTDLTSFLYENAKLCYDLLSRTTGLKPIMPQGAMYMMVGIEMNYFTDLLNGREFVEQLVAEQSVFCLPGECFNYPGYMRLVLTVPTELLKEACERINEFCTKHYRLKEINTIRDLDNSF